MGRDIVDPADSAEGLRLLELVGGRDHRLFAGKADRDDFGFLERTIMRMVKEPYGDHRDWRAIRDWATSIVRELTAATAAATPVAATPAAR
jgi:menaquinone-dependent protoporphyrinogen oxidase